MKPVLEKEVLLATEYANTLNQELLLTAVGFSCFVGHTETGFQCDHCWSTSSVIHSSVLGLSGCQLLTFFSMAWGTRMKCACLACTCGSTAYTKHACLPDTSIFPVFMASCIFCNQYAASCFVL